MANNYFGFTHGGTQYSAQPASAYPAAAAQTAYVQPAQPAAYAAAPRPQAYETYQSTHTSGQYAYAARTQVAPQPAAAYDANKTYYAQTAAAPAAAPAAVYTVAEASYNAAKPAYTSTTFQSPTTVRPTHTQKTATPVHSTSGSYTYQPSSTTSSSATTTYTGYDAAVYSAATSYYQQQQTKTTTGGANAWQNKKSFQQKTKPKQPPKQNQLHYCEVCKISCAGPQTYREHLEGQKHKKKEASAKGATATPPARGMNTLRCELCDVACTGADAYAAHIRGSKHFKVMKLHTKLGKPIPSTEPVVVTPGNSSTNSTASKANTTTSKAGAGSKTTTGTASGAANSNSAASTKKVVATPKITFVGGNQLKSTGAKNDEAKSEDKVEAVNTVEGKVDPGDIVIPGEKDVVPVGQEYIEEVRNEFGNVVSFHCKLCECKFNDPNAKIMHMKGRRHRLQYKKKVDPSLQVEVKPSIRARKIQEEKLRRQAAKEEYWRRRDAEERWRMEWEQRRYEEEMFRWQGHGRGAPGGPFGPGNPGPMPLRRPDTSDDRHVMAKHAAIYPTEHELQAVQNIVSSCEKSLKLVSDSLAEIDSPKPMDTDKKTEKKDEKKDEAEKKDGDKEEGGAPPRALKGVMRVGVLAKGLLLHEDLNVKLVVLCSEKPTRTLLERVADSLPKHLAEVSEDKYEVKMCVEKAAVIVSSVQEKEAPKTTCTITLTSPIMREEVVPEGESVQTKPDPPDVLDRQQCLEALAALRHAKWFQAMELLAEKCVSSGGTNMSPGDALRRVFECIASGILLPGGPGLYDPCEKEATDATAGLTSQEREDITASAQHALRLIAFRQIHKVLGMDQLPTPKFQQGRRANRKRRRTNSTGESTEGEGADGKKDKKEGESVASPAGETTEQN